MPNGTLRLTSDSVPLRGYWFSAVACMVVAVLACLMIALNALEIIRDRDAKGWKKTEGAVISSVIKSGCARGKSYHAEVRYRYAVAGRDYTGRRISFGDLECGAHEKAVSIIERFPEGARVAVYYDPEQVDESSLLIGEVTPVTWIGIVVGTVLFLASAGAAGFSFWRLSRNPKSPAR